MKESRVLVLNMTGSITELCRHLVLSGINLELADDKVSVESSLSSTDFLINPKEDVGKFVSINFNNLQRTEVFAQKLKEMNPFANVFITMVDNLENTLDSQNYSAVIYGFRTFKEAVLINNTCRKIGVPFYCLNTSGLFGFFYIDIGKEMTFIHHRKATDTDETHTITDSKTLEQYFSQFTDESKLTWNKRAIFKNDKFITLLLAHRYLQESGIDITLSQFIKTKGLPDSVISNPDFKDIEDKLASTYNLDFNPTASVIGAIVSQEIVKVITQKDFPSHGFAIYDSITERCQFE